jgi:4-alpha-glucanotransferase
MNNVRDPGECELYWNNELKPSINKQQWTKSEKEKLKELAEKYDHKNWPTIAEQLGVSISGVTIFPREPLRLCNG